MNKSKKRLDMPELDFCASDSFKKLTLQFMFINLMSKCENK